MSAFIVQGLRLPRPHCMAKATNIHGATSRFIHEYSHFSNPQRGMSSNADNRKRQKTALVLGSSGALGSAVSRHLSKSVGMRVVGADIVELPTELSENYELDGFISLPENAALQELTTQLAKGVHEFCIANTDAGNDSYDHETGEDLRGLDAIIVASGGWEGDPPLEPIDRDRLLPEEQSTALTEAATAYTDSVMRMRGMNLDPVIAAGFVAQHLSCDHYPLMVVMGATAALSPTPGMMNYGLAKAATHHLVQTLGSMNGNNLEHRALRKRGEAAQPPHLFPHISVVGILPTTIDTPNNRLAMPNGKFEQWTKPIHIAEEIGTWVESPVLRPHSGSLVKVIAKTDGSGSHFEIVY